MKFDDVLKQLGEFGPYQKKLYLLLCLPAIASSIQVIQTVVFLFDIPDHRCAIPDLENDTYQIQSEAHERLVNLTIPTVSGFYGNKIYSSCELYAITNTSDLWSPDVTNVTVPCHEWVYDKSQYISTIAQTMDLVCQKRSYVSHAKMLAMGGVLVGAIINGPLSDMFGRRPVIVVNVFFMVVVSIVIVWANSIPVLFLLLFLYHAFSIGEYMTCFVFGMEIVAPSKRMWAGVTINLFWSAGNMITALTAYLLRDWKIRQLVVSVPAVLYAYLFFLPESPRWLLEHGKTEEAKKVVMRIAKGNKVDLSTDVLDDLISGKEDEQPEPFWALFKSSVLIRRMIIICYIWFAVGIGFYGLSMNVTNLSGNIYLNFFLFILVEVFAYSLCFFLFDRIGRKRLLCASMLSTAAACTLPLIPVLVSERPNKWAINVLAITGNTCASAAMASVYAFTAELMPTTTRNAGMALSSAWCRLGSLMSPYIVDLTLHVTGRFGQILPMLVFGAITALAGFLALLLPDTFNRRLPETVDDAEKLGTKRYEEESITKEVELVALDTGSDRKYEVNELQDRNFNVSGL